MVEPQEPRARSAEREKEPSKNVKPVARERKERETRTVRTESKPTSSTLQRWRANRVVNFILEAYRELRYKVTWPTFEEARNMTIAVLALSAVVAAILGLADIGLFQLFRLINGQ
jgi:preprotein translocase subunit SecE